MWLRFGSYSRSSPNCRWDSSFIFVDESMNKIQGCKATNKKSWIIVMLKTNLHHCSTWKSQNGQYTSRPDMNNWKWLVVTKMTFLRSTKVNIFSIAMWKCYANSRHGTAVITAAHGGEVPKMASQFLSRNKKRWRYATPYLILFAARPSKLYNTNKNYFYSCYIAEAIGLYACARWRRTTWLELVRVHRAFI